MDRNSNFEKMTQEPIEKLICALAVPTIISMLITTIYNTADTYFAGKINSNSIAAIGIVYSFMSVVQAFGFLYGHGSGNFMSKALGGKNIKDAENIAGIGLLFSVCTGIVIGLFTFIFADKIAIFLGGNNILKDDVVSYLRTLAPGIPFIMGGLTLNNQFRFQGNALLGMIGIAFGGILNIFLDPLFMFTFHMGVKGAGIATSISQFISFIFLLFLNSKCGNLGYDIFNIKYSKKLIRILFIGGMPNFARQVIASIAVLLLNRAAVDYGEISVAAFTVMSRITMILGAAMIGFGQGFQPVCGYNYGAGLYKRVKKSFNFSIVISTFFFIIVAAVCIGRTSNIVSVFSDDYEVINLGVSILRYQCISLPFMGWIIMSGMFLQNIGKFKEATIISAARQGIIFIPLIFILTNVWGLYGIILVQPISDIGTFLISIPMTLKSLHNINNKIKN